MPVSLNPNQSDPTPTISRRKLKTTNKMVEDALIKLHNVKGVTLKKVFKFILENNNIDSLSNARIGLIKKHLIELRESGDIVNKTGRGFNGHFKLKDSNKFIKTIKKNEKQIKENANPNKKSRASTSKENIKAVKTKKLRAGKQILPKIDKPIQLSSLQNHYYSSIFDTPMVSSTVHSSTPLISNSFVPGAPAIKRKANKAKPSQYNLETPRSSLPKDKLKKHKRPEKKL